MTAPALWPPVAHYQPLAGSASATAPVTEQADPHLAADAYRLRIDNDGVQLAASDPAGFRSGQATLAQLRRLSQDGRLAGCVIDDAPAVAVRGVMLDISRDRVPTRAHLKRLVTQIASLKGNHLQLYTEHSVAYPGHDTVWREASPLSLDALRWLADLCTANGITLAANQNTLGHAERWLKHPAYAELAERLDVADAIARGEWCISFTPDDPRVMALVRELIDAQLDATGADLVNIGCDETDDIGSGRSAAAVARDGFAAVYGRHVGAIAEHCLARGATPMFWADMALSQPDAFDRIPPAAIALAWGYEADSPYHTWAHTLGGLGRDWWTCPGTAAWRCIGGRSVARRGSITAALAHGHRAGGASGMLVTEWGDAGHHQQWPVTWLGLAEGLGAAWAGRPAWNDAAVSRHAFDDASGHLATWLDALGRVDAALNASAPHPDRDGPLTNSGAIWQDSRQAWGRSDWLAAVGPWQQAAEAAEALAASAPTGDDDTARACRHSLAHLQWALDRALARRGARSASDLPARRTHLIAEHRARWLTISRPGGLDDSCAQWPAADDD